jgi:hypothetical protein
MELKLYDKNNIKITTFFSKLNIFFEFYDKIVCISRVLI